MCDTQKFFPFPVLKDLRENCLVKLQWLCCKTNITGIQSSFTKFLRKTVAKIRFRVRIASSVRECFVADDFGHRMMFNLRDVCKFPACLAVLVA